MVTRFTDIVNVFEGFGRQDSKMEITDKSLRPQPFKWESKTSDTKKANNLKKLPLEGAHWIFDDLVEKQEKKRQKEEGKKKIIALKAKKENEKNE